MRQRAALARALATDPSMLLMDEPFGALDALTRDRLHEELESLWAATRKTVVFVTHNVREAVALGTGYSSSRRAPGGSWATSASRCPGRARSKTSP